MANQMIALQARAPQGDPLGGAIRNNAALINQMSQQAAAQRQTQQAEQAMQLARNQETRAAAGETRDIEKFNAEQPARVAGALGGGLVSILRDPSDASIMQAGQTFASVGMEPDKFSPILNQIRGISDPNARKMFVLEFISQSEPARAALKFVMPEVKSEKVGDATVFYDANPASSTNGQELFRFTAPAEPVKMNQQVVDSTLYNVNPVTGVAAEAPIGDPTQNLTPPSRQPTFTSTGVRSPYAVGAGTGAPLVQPRTEQPAAVGGPSINLGTPGAGGNTFSRMIQAESRGKQFDRNGRPLTSSAGAIGIAQVMPGTAPEAAKLAGLPFDDNRYRNDPEYNLALGKAYYEKQLRDFGGDEKLAAAAYNAGPGAVRSALKKGGPDGWVNNVPKETRDYLKTVFGGAGTPARTPTGTGTPTGAGTPTSAAPKSQTVSEQQRQRGFVKTLELFDYNPETGADSISPLIKASTSGGLEKIGADIAGFIPESMGGGATPGAIATGQLQSLQDSMTFTKLREKLGAQVSDADVQLVASTMGDIANPFTPSPVRLAKWQNVVLPILVRGAGMKYVKPTGGDTGAGQRQVIRTGKTRDGRTVRKYSDGSIEYGR